MKPVVLPELRYRRSWMLGGILMLVVIAIVCLMPMEELPKTGFSDKTEHLLAFGAVAFWFGSIVMRYDLPWLALLLVAFGGLVEVGQEAMHLGRHGDWRDLAADTLGIVLGLGLALTPLGHWARVVELQIARLRG